MPYFYFNIRYQGHFIADRQGQKFQTIDEAHKEAVLNARDIIAQRARDGQEPDGDIIEVRDERGSVVDVVKLHDLVH